MEKDKPKFAKRVAYPVNIGTQSRRFKHLRR